MNPFVTCFRSCDQTYRPDCEIGKLPFVKRQIVFQWIEPCLNPRLEKAQELLRKSVLELELEPTLFPAGPQLVKFRKVLDFAAEHSPGDSFVWCNSDVILRKNPYDLEDASTIRGFHRREIPGGEHCGGVDMYLIPKSAWTNFLRPAMPDLWCGASHIDWWLTRAAALAGKYTPHYGYIDHPSHEESGASKSRNNKFFRHNVKAYNSWARQHGAATDDYRLSLPLVGESLSPLTDYACWAGKKLGLRQ